MTARPLPHSIEAEQALLGALLLNNEIAERLAGLEERHFYDPVHGRIFALAMRRIAEARRADAVALKMLLADDEGLQALGGTNYLASLAGAAVSIVAAPDYARDIIDLARRRHCLAALDEASAAIPSAEDPDDVLAQLEAALTDNQDGPQRHAGASVREAMVSAVTGMQEAFQGGTPSGISLGIPALEEAIGKAGPGDYLLLAGRPGMGKSALAVEIARRLARAGVGVPYWCAEMFAEDNASRMIAAALREKGVTLSYRDARAGRMSEAEFRAVIEAAREMERLPIHFIDPAITDLRRLSHEFRRVARRFQREGRPVVCVVDYLQKIRTGAQKPYERVSEASAGIKTLAMQLGCPFLVLSQLSRAVENRDPPRPNLSDLRDSGEIEQDANTALLLYREAYYLERALEADPDSEHANETRAALNRASDILEIIVAKQRSGPIRTVRVGFDGATNAIWELGQVVPFPSAGQEGFDL